MRRLALEVTNRKPSALELLSFGLVVVWGITNAQLDTLGLLLIGVLWTLVMGFYLLLGNMRDMLEKQQSQLSSIPIPRSKPASQRDKLTWAGLCALLIACIVLQWIRRK